MTVQQHYEGGYQYGAVRFEAMADLDRTVTRNCSRCGRLGSILPAVPEDQFKLKSGEESLTEYVFNRHVIHHFFCKVCGIQPFSHGVGPSGVRKYAVNVRCMDGADPDSLKPSKFDGRSY